MTPSKARFVTACQQVLALAVVVAALTPAASIVTLDVVGQTPVPGAHGAVVRPSASMAAYTAEAVKSSKVPTAPVDAKVREVPLTLPAVAGRRVAPTTPQARVTPGVKGGVTRITSRPQPVTGYGEVGITWAHGDNLPQDTIHFQVRSQKDGAWSDWQQLTYDPEHAPDPNSAEGRHARPGTDPLLVGDVANVQVRADTTTPLPADMKLAVISPGTPAHTTTERAAIDTSTMDGQDGAQSVYRSTQPATGSDASTDGSTDSATLAAAVYTPEPVIYSRAQWGADESIREKSSLHYYEVHAGFVHHTVNANGYSRDEVPGIIRSIYAYHVKSRGWSDIGYNFLVDRFGRVWEGRYGGVDRPVVGAHTLNYNDYSFAASAIGNYDITQPSKAMIQAYGSLYAWKLSLHGVDAGSTKQWVGSRYFQAINGHRDAAATACPGRYLYAKLPEIRRLAAADQRGWAGRQLESNLASTPQPDLLVRRASDGEGFIIPTGGLLHFQKGHVTATGLAGSAGVEVSPDLTGDGRADLLVRSSDGSVAIRPGDGRGGFGAATATLRRFAGKDLLTPVGDLNGDHHDDLVARNPDSGRLIAYLGHDDGTFGQVRLSTAWSGFDLLAGVGDLDGDHHPDLVARDTAGHLWLVPGTGTAHFGTKRQLPGTWSQYDVITGLGDYTSDGRNDLVVRRASDQATFVLPGDGAGGFRHASAPLDRFAGATGLTGGGSVVGSSAADLVAVRGDDLVTYQNPGAFDTGDPIDTGANFSGADKIMRAGDWNRDGYGDVISRNAKTGNLYLWLGNGSGRLGSPHLLAKGFGSVKLLAAVGDMTGDGYPDLMGAPGGGSMYIYPGKGTGGLKKKYVAYGAIDASRQIPVGRWNRDGAPDSLLYSDGKVALYPGNGPGGLTRPQAMKIDLSHDDWVVGVSDLRLTGHPDLIVRQKKTGYLFALNGSATHGFSAPRFLTDQMKGYDLVG